MFRAVLIVNHHASTVTPERVRAVEAELARAADVETLHTQGRGHATELAERATDADAIFVFSGDGGFNEVLNGVDGRVPVGFLPGGGASVLARLLHLPRDPVRAARQLRGALTAGRTRRISLGRVNGRRFAFASGLGLDAEAVRRIEQLGRTPEGRRAGNATFALTIFRLIAQRRARFEPALEVEGLGRAAFAFVAKSDPYTYAGPIPVHVAPQARLELGLDMVAPVAVRPRTLPRLLVYAALGRGQERARNVLYGHDLDRIRIVCDGPTALHVDGEDLGDVTEANYECERGAVSVLV